MVITANLPIFLTGALAVQLRDELALGRAALGGAIAVILAAASLSSSYLGNLAQRWGPVRALRLSAVLTALGGLGIAAFAADWPSLLPSLILVGFGLSMAESAGNQLLQDRVRTHRLGSVFGIKQSAPPLAAMLAGLAVPFAVASDQWRGFYAAAGVLSLLSLLVLPGPEPDRGRDPADSGQLLLRAPLVVMSIGLGCGFAATNGVATFLVDSAVTKGVPPARAGLYLTVSSIVASITRLVMGRLADGRSIEGVFRMLVGAMLAGTGGYLFFATGDPRLVLPGALLAFGIGYGWAGLGFLAVARVAARAAAAASGLVLTGAFIGGLAGPLVTGVLADSVGYQVTWLFLCGLTVTGAMILWACGRWMLRIGDGITS
jgi:MFS family permease